jgi:hypothetical protein
LAKLFFSVWHWVRQDVWFSLTHGLCVCRPFFCNIVYNLSNFVFYQKFWCTPKNEGKRVHVPPDEKTCGYAAVLDFSILQRIQLSSLQLYKGRNKHYCIFQVVTNQISHCRRVGENFFSVSHWVRQEVWFSLTHGLCVCRPFFCNIVYNLSNFVFVFN